MMNIDFHIHTKYSFDSFMKIKKMIKIAKQRNIMGFAICDHDYFSYPKLKNDLKDIGDGFFVIPGMEIKTYQGDLIGILINEQVRADDFFECIDQIKSQGGISILPHPYRRKKNIDVQKLGRAVDWLEVINSRSTKKQNSMAMELSETLNKPKTAGSDAHLYSEIGTSYITIKKVDTIDEIIKEISNGNIQIAKNISSRKVHYWSSFIGALKTRNFRSFIKGVNKELRSVFK